MKAYVTLRRGRGRVRINSQRRAAFPLYFAFHQTRTLPAHSNIDNRMKPIALECNTDVLRKQSLGCHCSEAVMVRTTTTISHLRGATASGLNAAPASWVKMTSSNLRSVTARKGLGGCFLLFTVYAFGEDASMKLRCLYNSELPRRLCRIFGPFPISRSTNTSEGKAQAQPPSHQRASMSNIRATPPLSSRTVCPRTTRVGSERVK